MFNSLRFRDMSLKLILLISVNTEVFCCVRRGVSQKPVAVLMLVLPLKDTSQTPRLDLFMSADGQIGLRRVESEITHHTCQRAFHYLPMTDFILFQQPCNAFPSIHEMSHHQLKRN